MIAQAVRPLHLDTIIVPAATAVVQHAAERDRTNCFFTLPSSHQKAAQHSTTSVRKVFLYLGRKSRRSQESLHYRAKRRRMRESGESLADVVPPSGTRAKAPPPQRGGRKGAK